MEIVILYMTVYMNYSYKIFGNESIDLANVHVAIV